VLLLAPGVALAQKGLTITENIAPDFGTILSGPAGRQFILNTNDTITGADAGDYLFGAVSGDLTLHRQGNPKGINIIAENISTTGGLTVANILCSYDGGAQLTCDGAGINATTGQNKTLKVGVDMSTSQVHNGGDAASVSFDIAVTFL